ncbi:28078_t:CDS:1, partial [Gigaspora margarita]
LGSHEYWHQTIEIQNKVIYSKESFISQQSQLKTINNKLELQTSILESQPSKISIRNLM